MAIVNINYDCGCGAHLKTVEEAIKHVDEARHILNVSGTVRSSERKVRKASLPAPVAPRPRRIPTTPTPPPLHEERQLGFSELRARLQRKSKE